MPKPYDPKSHSKKDCRNDHPELNKIPFGFQGFHDEDYDFEDEE